MQISLRVFLLCVALLACMFAWLGYVRERQRHERVARQSVLESVLQSHEWHVNANQQRIRQIQGFLAKPDGSPVEVLLLNDELRSTRAAIQESSRRIRVTRLELQGTP
jgi:hypothetical protein